MELLQFSKNNSKAIQQLFIKTFSDSEGEAEGTLIGNLVDDLINNTDADDFDGFIATEDKQIIGSIFFSRLTFQQVVNAFLLSPVAIHPEYQGKGIGQRLINFGIEQLKKKSVTLIITYGDPAFYSKVGFIQIDEQTIKPPFVLSQPEGWMAQSLDNDKIIPIRGNTLCVKAFNNPELW